VPGPPNLSLITTVAIDLYIQAMIGHPP
jgi:hypothetical protein